MNCPFCQAKLGKLFRLIRQEMSEGATNGTLCTECGEPLFLTAGGFRKPTPEEYVDIATDDAWQTARLAWLEVHQTNGKEAMRANWANFNDKALQDIIKQLGPPPSSNFLQALELIFQCGAKAALHTVSCDLDRCDSRTHLDAILRIHHAELDMIFEKLTQPAKRRTQ